MVRNAQVHWLETRKSIGWKCASALVGSVRVHWLEVYESIGWKCASPLVGSDVRIGGVRQMHGRGPSDAQAWTTDAHVESMDGFIPIHPWNALRQWMDSRPPMDGSHRVNGWIATNPWMGGGKSIHGLTLSAPHVRPPLPGPNANAIRRPRPASPPSAPHLAAQTQ